MDRVLAACKTGCLFIASLSEFIPLPLVKNYAEVADSGSHDVVRSFRETITASLCGAVQWAAQKGASLESFDFSGEVQLIIRGT
ncbi:hypothetical protein GT347_20615 [Xylophilus rhododendri]|uniref:Uncharacterized protein n=1 Tax=Xylophilus rhododendri TaxID=2697032 RepID=A0A857JBN9_9BURK|nr:hypothetical protein [Xylophilus rhododendri]QHJ00169.1 hypothetical protein GT347_20615 [Xylophilus rhododendri]